MKILHQSVCSGPGLEKQSFFYFLIFIHYDEEETTISLITMAGEPEYELVRAEWEPLEKNQEPEPELLGKTVRSQSR